MSLFLSICISQVSTKRASVPLIMALTFDAVKLGACIKSSSLEFVFIISDFFFKLSTNISLLSLFHNLIFTGVSLTF